MTFMAAICQSKSKNSNRWSNSGKRKGLRSVSKGNRADPELEPQVEEDWGDEQHFFGYIPQQIEADWHEKWGPLLEGFPSNILFAAIRNDAQTGSNRSQRFAIRLT